MRIPTELIYVRLEDIESDIEVYAKSRYLYWACFRGHANLVKHILETDKISPFARVYEGRSPMMASMIGKQANFKGRHLTSQEEH